MQVMPSTSTSLEEFHPRSRSPLHILPSQTQSPCQEPQREGERCCDTLITATDANDTGINTHSDLVSDYPEAVQFFAADLRTGQFSNPFTAPPTNRDRSASPSPLTRPNDYGLIESWDFTNRSQPISPVSSLSNYSQFEDDGIPVSPLSEHNSRSERRESSVFSPGMVTTPIDFEAVLGRLPSFSSTSSSSSSPSIDDISAEALISQLDDLIFDTEACEFFSGLDVEWLVATQASSAYSLEDHDDLHDEWDLEYEWPCVNWLPHDPSWFCHCHWCIEYWMPDDDEEMYQPHDFDWRCPCPVCVTFWCLEDIREMEKQEQARDEEMLRQRKRKRLHAEGEDQAGKSCHNEGETSHQLRRETRPLKAAPASEEDQLLGTDYLDTNGSSGRVETTRCPGLFCLLRQLLRLPSSA